MPTFCRLPCLLTLAAVIGLPPGAMAQQSPVATLQRAKDCKGSMSKFGFGNPTDGQGKISMVNDGGWCWVQFTMIIRGNYMVPDLTTTQPPQHGTLLTGGVDADGHPHVRYAYRPAPGFVGADSFAVHIQGASGTWETAVNVSVTK
jgi:hypothetical protein